MFTFDILNSRYTTRNANDYDGSAPVIRGWWQTHGVIFRHPYM